MNYPYGRNKPKPNRNENFTRINWQIKAQTVRLVQEGNQLGVMPIDQARRLATEAGLDLVEIAPNAKPPVCEIKDYGKFLYEEKIKQKENARRQRESKVEIKELRLRPGIAQHDVDTKVSQARKFIEEGKKVQFNLQFKGFREISHKDNGFIIVNNIVKSLSEVADVEKEPKFEGNKIICRLTPKTHRD